MRDRPQHAGRHTSAPNSATCGLVTGLVIGLVTDSLYMARNFRYAWDALRVGRVSVHVFHVWYSRDVRDAYAMREMSVDSFFIVENAYI